MTHLSKEIEINMNNIYSFRNKSNFTLFISPFVMLGVLLSVSGGDTEKLKVDYNEWLLLAVIIVVYVGIGIFCAFIEKGLTKRNNTLRQMMIDLQYKDAKIDFQMFSKNESLVWAYFLIYSSLALEFFLIFRLIT